MSKCCEVVRLPRYVKVPFFSFFRAQLDKWLTSLGRKKLRLSYTERRKNSKKWTDKDVWNIQSRFCRFFKCSYTRSFYYNFHPRIKLIFEHYEKWVTNGWRRCDLFNTMIKLAVKFRNAQKRKNYVKVRFSQLNKPIRNIPSTHHQLNHMVLTWVKGSLSCTSHTQLIWQLTFRVWL